MGKITHGCSRSPEYKTWSGMIKRCRYSCVNGFERYGGRGIHVCDRWLKFGNFLLDMGRKPAPVYTIERIDPNGHYEPRNCKWATREEQVSNTRRNRNLTFQGKTQHLAEWSRETGIKCSTISMRLRRGWTPQKALGCKFDCNFTSKLLSHARINQKLKPERKTGLLT